MVLTPKACFVVLKNYFGDFTEESIRNNFVLIYELLDEVLDYGYPQNCSTDVLKLYITQTGDKTASAERAASQAVTIQATGAISWRKEGIKYRKNELFIDVVEHCNLMMSSKGTILRNDVSGVILVKCYLSGTPECKFGLNDKLLLDNELRGHLSFQLQMWLMIYFHMSARSLVTAGLQRDPECGEFYQARRRANSPQDAASQALDTFFRAYDLTFTEEEKTLLSIPDLFAW